MSTLTRHGARNLTVAIDRIASAVQDNPSVLGIDPKIAKDFAYRCDLISDAIETRAVTNFPKQGEAAVQEIGAETTGPIYEEDASPDLKGQFTQESFTELTDIAEKLEKAATSIAASLTAIPSPVTDHGFDLTK